MLSPSVEQDPLSSPHPVPWRWFLSIQAEATAAHQAKTGVCRSHALISPDRNYAAYSRIQVDAQPEFSQSRVSSVVFIEGLSTQDIYTIVPRSPLTEKLFANPAALPADYSGTAAMLIPVSWSQQSDRLLVREFEAVLGSDFASDYAVVWEREQHQACTLSPQTILYTHAILLGWSQTYPDQVLFRAGTIGDPEWPQWRVDFSSRTQAATNDLPRIFGQISQSYWSGIQPEHSAVAAHHSHL